MFAQAMTVVAPLSVWSATWRASAVDRSVSKVRETFFGRRFLVTVVLIPLGAVTVSWTST
jgi:hypothetical protein